MTYIVTDNCIKCKYIDCVEVCPVDCFYEGENMLVIHPDECIDCGVCEPECPAEAIKPDTEGGLDKWLEINTKYASAWPNITEKRDALRPTPRNWTASRQVREVLLRQRPARATDSPDCSVRCRSGCLPDHFRNCRISGPFSVVWRCLAALSRRSHAPVNALIRQLLILLKNCAMVSTICS